MALDYLRQYARQTPPSREPDLVENIRPNRSDVLFADSPISDKSGDVLVVESERAASDRHGPHPFAALRDVTGSQLALISRDPELAYAHLSRALFLDTETTGLSTRPVTYV